MDTLQAAKKALDKAKINLMSRPDSAFFTTVCFSLHHRFDEKIPTACTNGRTVWYSPQFFMGLSVEEQVFVLLHETLHVAYLHMVRIQDRKPNRWNIAADHVINLQLIERGFQMPKMGIADSKFAGLSVEEVYAQLPECPGEPMMSDLLAPEGEPGAFESEVQDILVRASIQSKLAGDKPGSIPGEIEIFLNKLLDPKLPWQRILQKYMQSMAKNDYTFRKPNRRFFPKHHLPSLWSESLMDLVIAVDTSGSVSGSEFNRFVSEINGILRMMKPAKITLIQFDTRIKSVNEVRSTEELSKVTFTGRGGTCIEPVLEWATRNKPQLLLVFSDGYFHFHQQDSRTHVVWLIHNNERFTPPFGKVINYSMEG